MNNRLLRNLESFELFAAMELAVAVLPGVSQTPHGAATEPANVATPAAFDVASVRPSKPGIKRFSEDRWTPDGFLATNSGLQYVLLVAYDIHDPNLIGYVAGGAQLHGIHGAPAWVLSDQYDIRAKISESDLAELNKFSSRQQMARRREMLQALLADRFKLKVHFEPAEIECYALVVGKNGLRTMKKEPDDETPHLNWSGRTEVAAHAFPFGAFVENTLSAQVGCPVVDETGLAGKYDFALKWSVDSSSMSGQDGANVSDTSGPTIFTALEEQLGLKLEHTKVPMEKLVIDHIERPTEN